MHTVSPEEPQKLELQIDSIEIESIYVFEIRVNYIQSVRSCPHTAAGTRTTSSHEDEWYLRSHRNWDLYLKFQTDSTESEAYTYLRFKSSTFKVAQSCPHTASGTCTDLSRRWMVPEEPQKLRLVFEIPDRFYWNWKLICIRDSSHLHSKRTKLPSYGFWDVYRSLTKMSGTWGATEIETCIWNSRQILLKLKAYMYLRFESSTFKVAQSCPHTASGTCTDLSRRWVVPEEPQKLRFVFETPDRIYWNCSLYVFEIRVIYIQSRTKLPSYGCREAYQALLTKMSGTVRCDVALSRAIFHQLHI